MDDVYLFPFLMPTKNIAAVVENVAGAINVLNVFVTHVDPIRFPIATNFPSAIFAERYREKKIYSLCLTADATAAAAGGDADFTTDFTVAVAPQWWKICASSHSQRR